MTQTPPLAPNRFRPLPTFDLRDFTLSHGDTLVTEASQFNSDGGFHIGRLADGREGIAVWSPRSGRIEQFYLDSVQSDEGDVLGWNFRAVNPALKVLTVIVYND